MRKQRKLSGFVFYEGPSMLDSAPIVAIATLGSSNSKTGGMAQTWILRADINPIDAARRGLDASICGDCKHRGQYRVRRRNGRTVLTRIASTRSCYVRLDTAPANVWRTYRRDRYSRLSIAEASDRMRGRIVRLGAYGDPAAVPIGVWQALLEHSASHTGYTHQWCAFPEFSTYCMASCDSSEERVAARMLGFRTFRVAPAAGWVREGHEVLCPASSEAGKRTTCAACRACGGTSAKARADMMIPAHGSGRNLVAAAA